ncbi:hypothetical protein CSUI_010571 [Cystoisospora suis]|uniref:SRS domain-containing protein n=1 Tax=Cystoisospora suis TaxID=483139 RepID=A0A2C6KDB5_9APIC|nr:hypothetical protein CSUI_010571 [Cystoisospora suis]
MEVLAFVAIWWFAFSGCTAVHGEEEMGYLGEENENKTTEEINRSGAVIVCSNHETALEITSSQRSVQFKCPKDTPIIIPADVRTVLQDRGDGSCGEEEVAVGKLASGARRSLTAEENPKTNTLSFPELPDQSLNLCLECTSVRKKVYQKSCRFIVKVEGKSTRPWPLEEPGTSKDLFQAEETPDSQKNKSGKAEGSTLDGFGSTSAPADEEPTIATTMPMRDIPKAAPVPAKRGSRCFRINVATRDGTEITCW